MSISPDQAKGGVPMAKPFAVTRISRDVVTIQLTAGHGILSPILSINEIKKKYDKSIISER